MRSFVANDVLIILRAPAYHPSWIQQWEELQPRGDQRRALRRLFIVPLCLEYNQAKVTCAL
jgi:hypothetical protein